MARKRADIDVVYPGEGVFEVDGYMVGDTIAATRTLNADYKTYAKAWSVTHVPTGLSLLAAVPRAVALAYADRLVELGYDRVHEADPEKAADELGPGLGRMAAAIYLGLEQHPPGKKAPVVALAKKLTPAMAKKLPAVTPLPKKRKKRRRGTRRTNAKPRSAGHFTSATSPCTGSSSPATSSECTSSRPVGIPTTESRAANRSGQWTTWW